METCTLEKEDCSVWPVARSDDPASGALNFNLGKEWDDAWKLVEYREADVTSALPFGHSSAHNTMSRRTTDYDRPVPQMGAGMVIAVGLGAGLAGAIAMTFGEKLEQMFTGRPNSHVPGLTLARLIGKPDSYKTTLNLPMHYGQAAVVGIARAVMSYVGMRGPFVDFIFTGIRLLTDQTLENWTGAGALPWTWPVNEQIIDIIHKGIFAFATGFVCDLFIQ